MTGPAATLVEFTRALRTEGIPLGAAAAGDLAAACELVGLGSGEDTYHAFRSLVVTRHDQIPTFDRVFASFFGRPPPGPAVTVTSSRPRSWTIHAGEPGAEGDGAEDGDVTAVGASWAERLRDRDFADLDPDEVVAIRMMIAQMMWRPHPNLTRRRRPARDGDRPDLRRTIRRSVSAEGDVLRLSTTRRKTQARPIILVLDISGSMERYAEMLLYFAHAARSRLGRMEAFVFSTRLTRITRQLDRRDPWEAIREVSAAVHDWSGGTRIGECLRTFNRDWTRRVGRGGPILLIVSDGWDRGEPEVLSAEMERLHRSVHRVVWLNPLAGRTGYAPETRGMRAALPYVDDFLAAGTLTHLAGLVELLESLPPRSR